MVAWTNRAVYQLPRNGLTTHTIDPTSATNLVSGAAFTPTAGRMLIIVVEGAVTSTTPTGWTLPSGGSAINNTGLYVWHRTAASGSNAAATTHNGADYPIAAAVYEFPTGSSFVKAISATAVALNGANPNLTALTGTNLVMAAKALGTIAGDGTVGTVWSGTGSPVEDWDVVAWAPSTDGYVATLAYVEGFTGSSWSPTGTITGISGNAEALTFAVNVATPGGGSYPATGTVASTSTVQGAVTSRRPIAGVVASTTSVAGVVVARLAVSGTVVTVSTVTGRITERLSGVVESTTVITGQVTAKLPAIGLVSSAITIAGAITSRLPITGEVGAVTAVIGQLDAAGGLAGTVTTISSVTGTVAARRAATGVVVATSTVVGQIDSPGGMAGAVLSVTVITGSVSGRLGITGVVASVTTVTGTLGGRDVPFPERLELTATTTQMVLVAHVEQFTLTGQAPELTLEASW